MASGDIIFTNAPEFTLQSENETGQNATTVVLKGYALSNPDAVVATLAINNGSVGWAIGESPFKFGKTYSLVITEV
jgi:hypothetical protein